MKSVLDSIIIDMIMDHFNIQSLSGLDYGLSSEDFDNMVKLAEKMYYKQILHNTPVGVEGEA